VEKGVLPPKSNTCQVTQEEIDSLGDGKTIRAWETRFELAYEKCKDENDTLMGGLAPTAVRFAHCLRKKHLVIEHLADSGRGGGELHHPAPANH